MARLIVQITLIYIGITGLVLAVDSWDPHWIHALFEGFIGAGCILLALTAPKPHE